MYSLRSIAACALVILFALPATGAMAQRIGNATATKNKVDGIVRGAAQTISPGTDVYSNETVRTAVESVADLKFLDETKLSVGPRSEVRLDKFVYNPSGSAGSVVINATRGAFRFVTGTQDVKAYKIRTPYGTLGIRG